MPRRPDANLIRSFNALRDEWRESKGLEPRADYSAATPSTFRRVRRGLGGDADAHYWSDYKFFRMIEYVRDMDRNDFLIGQIVDRLVDNIIRNGADLEPQTGDKATDAAIWQDHQDWANDPARCDAAGRHTFVEKERLTLRHRIIDGDIVHVWTNEDTIQTFEADRIRTPHGSRRRIVHGVELDSRGRRVRYYIVREGATIMPRLERVPRVADTVPIATYGPDGELQVFHVLKPSRFSQTRGVTAFHAVFDMAGQIEDIQFSEVVRRQLVSSIGLAIEKTRDAPDAAVQLGGRQSDGTGDDGVFDKILEEIAPGMILRLPVGMQAKILSADVPGESFFQHLKMLVQAVGCVINMPLVLITLDASETNFSGWRGALDQAQLSFVCEQEHGFRQFNRPIYRRRLLSRMQDEDALGIMLRRQAELKGLEAMLRHQWHGPRWKYIQPLQDAQANAVRLQTGQISLRRLHSEIGSDFEQFVEENVEDTESWIRKAMEATRRLQSEFPEFKNQLHWTHLYHRDFFHGGQVFDSIDMPNQAADPKQSNSE